MKCIHLLVASFATVPLLLLAAEPDRIKERLDKDRATYDKDSKKAKEQFLADLTARIEECQKEGETDLVNTLTAEKSAFEQTGTLPKSKASKNIARKYENTVYAAMVNWKDAMERAKQEYTRAKKQEKANNLKVEIEAFQKVIESRFPDRKNRENKLTNRNGKFEAKRWQPFHVLASRPSRANPPRSWLFVSIPRDASYNWKVDNEGGHSGPKCLRITGRDGVGLVDSPVEVANFNKRYIAGCWVKTDKPSTTIQLGFDYFDANNERIPKPQTDVLTIERRDGWQYIENSDRLDDVPSTKFLRVALRVIGAGTAWFDDVLLIVEDE